MFHIHTDNAYKKQFYSFLQWYYSSSLYHNDFSEKDIGWRSIMDQYLDEYIWLMEQEKKKILKPYCAEA
jgi:hypothetical protein